MKRVHESMMTLGEFIQQMKEGWGFWRPYRVQRIGNALDEIIPGGLRGKIVDVRHEAGSYGYGCNCYYWYLWRVNGVKLEGVSEGRLGPDEVDYVFGFHKGNLPYLVLTDEGFEVGYES